MPDELTATLKDVLAVLPPPVRTVDATAYVVAVWFKKLGFAMLRSVLRSFIQKYGDQIGRAHV